MPKICIDPGHNRSGADTGAQGNGLYEQDLNLDIARYLRAMLLNNGFQVIMTRDGDFVNGPHATVNESLKTRCDLANNFGADLFVSIHVNAGGGTGTEVYALPGGQAVVAAQRVLDRLVYACNWPNRGVKTDRGFYVLVHTDMPAILTENGFIDSGDSNKLASAGFRQAIAEAHAKGICDFFGINYQQTQISGSDFSGQEASQAVNAGSQQNKTGQATQGQTTQGQPTQEQATQEQATQEQATPALEGTGSSSGFKTAIMGYETIAAEQCKRHLNRINPSANPRIIDIYKRYGESMGIKWGYAVAQMFKETGYLKFGGSVAAAQNNFGGLGATGGGETGAAFRDMEEGVLAHLEHLFAYASAGPLPSNFPKVDPRFDIISRGSCPYWEDLDGRWAVPGKGYGEDIIRIYDETAAEPLTSTGNSSSSSTSGNNVPAMIGLSTVSTDSSANAIVPVQATALQPTQKAWYDSKTLWVNAVLLIAMLAQQITGKDIFTPEIQTTVIVGINVLLRIVTQDKITWK